MSIVAAAIVPHPPILVPSIGKENVSRLEETLKAFDKLNQKFRERRVETILIISPHGTVQVNSFSMNLRPEFKAGFEEFGDFSTKAAWPGNIGLTYRVREKLETRAPLQLVSEENLDHGASVPLLMLTQGAPKMKVIPLYYSGLGREAHFKFGQLLRHELIYNKDRVAVVASGDLSHRLTKDSPAGYSSKGKKFDKKIIEYLSKNKTGDILKMDKKLIIEAGECGLKSILILLGILDGIRHEPKKLSYEAPFGVGYLVMDFII